MEQDSATFWADIKKYEEQLAASPDSYCFARLSEVYLKLGLVDDALHTAQKGVARHPAYVGGQRALAMAYQAKGMNSDCVEALSRIVDAMPDDVAAQKMLGKLLASQGNISNAVKAFRTVLDFSPEDVECRVELAALERQVAFGADADVSDEEVIEELEIIEELEVLDDEEGAGFCFEEEEQAPSAADAAVSEPAPFATATLAELYIQQGFTDKALEVYRSILADDPANAAAAGRVAELEGCEVKSFAGSEPATGYIEPQPELPAAADQLAIPTVPEPNRLAPAASVPSEGISDNALTTLEGWLDNIRRIRSCR